MLALRWALGSGKGPGLSRGRARSSGKWAVGATMPSPRDVFQLTPEGVTAAANALPAGANLANAELSTVVEDAGLEGGWTDGKTTIHSRRVGHVSRFLIDGL